MSTLPGAAHGPRMRNKLCGERPTPGRPALLVFLRTSSTHLGIMKNTRQHSHGVWETSKTSLDKKSSDPFSSPSSKCTGTRGI